MSPRRTARASSLFLLTVASCLAGHGDDGASAPQVAPPAAEPRLPHEAAPRRPKANDDARVVLVVIDGARWQEVFEGVSSDFGPAHGARAMRAEELLPHLHALVRTRGAALGAPDRGEAIAASGPSFVSLPGYTEIFTGRPPAACSDNDCAPPEEPTVLDELAARGEEVAVFSSWSKIARVAWSSDDGPGVASAGRDLVRGEPALKGDEALARTLDEGRRAAAFPGDDDFRPDRYTARAALRYLERRRPRFLFVGLGEPDEYAHRGDYRGYVAALRAADAVVGELASTLDRMGEDGARTTLFVTADHGRAHDYRHHGGAFPESARVWLVAAGAGVGARGYVAAPEPRHLADIAPTIRSLFGLAPDASPEAGRVLREIVE